MKNVVPGLTGFSALGLYCDLWMSNQRKGSFCDPIFYDPYIFLFFKIESKYFQLTVVRMNFNNLFIALGVFVIANVIGRFNFCLLGHV